MSGKSIIVETIGGFNHMVLSQLESVSKIVYEKGSIETNTVVMVFDANLDLIDLYDVNKGDKEQTFKKPIKTGAIKVIVMGQPGRQFALAVE